MTLRAFLKSYLILENEKYEFFLIYFSYFNKLNVKNIIFFLGIRYMLLANKWKHKTVKKQASSSCVLASTEQKE